MSRSRYRGTIKHNIKIDYIIILIMLMFIIGGMLIKFGMDFSQNGIPIYSYTIERNDNYEVLLKPNSLYESEILPSGGYYASKSINDYIINFNYRFKGNNKVDIDYNYNVTANLIGTVIDNDNQEKQIWNRNFILLENKNNNQSNKDEFLVDEEINVDYEYYNELARTYEKTYGITINSVLKLRLNINYNINYLKLGIDNKEKVEDYIELDIPITNTVTEVTENYEKNTTKDIFMQNNNIKIIYIICCILGGLFIITAVIITIIKIRKNKEDHKNLYESNIKRIMRYYRDLIVTITNEPNIEKLNIMNVDLLEDLIDLAEQNNSNIIHYEVDKDKKSKLYVILDNYVYIYTVTADKLR